MARKLIEHIYDDLDGTLITSPDDGRTVTFTIDRATYEIDLTTDHAKELKENLQPFIKAARSVKIPRHSKRPSRTDKDPDAIRAWAREQGHKVSDYGRIPFAIVEAYNQAH